VTKDEAEAMFLRHLAAIERLTANACRQSRIAGDEIDDLTSHVKLALIQGDYAIIRKFQGRSSFTTFLTTVIRRLISQHEIKEWGRWRPSAKAKRLGQLAMTVERLLTREGWSIPEVAHEVARRHPGCATGDILEIAHQLPQPHGRPQQMSISDLLHTVIDADDCFGISSRPSVKTPAEERAGGPEAQILMVIRELVAAERGSKLPGSERYVENELRCKLIVDRPAADLLKQPLHPTSHWMIFLTHLPNQTHGHSYPMGASEATLFLDDVRKHMPGA
jgi:hypothetical protein